MNKNKGIIGIGLILAIVLGVIVIGGGAYYLGKSKTENKEVVKTEKNLLEYKTPCEISSISKKTFSFSYPEEYSIKEIKPEEGDVPLSGVMQITIQPKDGSEPIIIGPDLENCRFTGLKLCNKIDDLYRIFTNNNSESSTYAYNKILSTIKTVTDCKKSDNNQQANCTSNSPSTIKVISPNGGEVYKAGDKITVKWESCNVDPNSIGIGLIRHGSSTSYTQREWVDDYAGFTLGGFDPYKGTADDGIQEITLPLSTNPNLISGQHYFISISGTGDITNVGSGYGPGDLSDGLFTINSSKTVSLDMSSELARTYTTAFNNALKQSANFNGHYSIASWGCGAGVMCYGIVDKLNGKAYSAPGDDYNNSSGYFGDADFDSIRWSVNSNIFKVIGYTSIDTYKFENEKFIKIGSIPFPKN